MAPDEPTADLVDVIYRDPNRVPSLYAQLFGGHLVNIERTTAERKGKETAPSGGLNLGGILKGEVSHKRVAEETEGTKENLQPHNNDAIDVVSEILARKQLHGGYRQAENGAVIRMKGTLFFFDPHIMRVASVLASDKKEKGDQYSGKQIKDLINKMVIPPIFFIVDREGGTTVVAGTIHESGLSEPISSFHLKHGGDGLPNVTLVGVKEVRSPLADVLPQMMLSMGKAYRGFADTLIPPNAIRVSPLCIYRELAK